MPPAWLLPAAVAAAAGVGHPHGGHPLVPSISHAVPQTPDEFRSVVGRIFDHVERAVPELFVQPAVSFVAGVQHTDWGRVNTLDAPKPGGCPACSPTRLYTPL